MPGIIRQVGIKCEVFYTEGGGPQIDCFLYLTSNLESPRNNVEFTIKFVRRNETVVISETIEAMGFFEAGNPQCLIVQKPVDEHGLHWFEIRGDFKILSQDRWNFITVEGGDIHLRMSQDRSVMFRRFLADLAVEGRMDTLANMQLTFDARSEQQERRQQQQHQQQEEQQQQRQEQGNPRHGLN